MISNQPGNYCNLPTDSIIKNCPGVGSMAGRNVTYAFEGVQETMAHDIKKLNEINKKGGR